MLLFWLVGWARVSFSAFDYRASVGARRCKNRKVPRLGASPWFWWGFRAAVLRLGARCFCFSRIAGVGCGFEVACTGVTGHRG